MAATLQDPFLGKRLRRRLPPKAGTGAAALLDRIARARPELDRLAREADRHPPVLEAYDRWGSRIDDVVHHASYDRLGDWAYRDFALVALAHEPRARAEFEGYPRSVAFAGGLAFAMSEQGLFCPLCMTDGAARILTQENRDGRWDDYVARLTSPDANRWTGAMFLTERQGGSDVGANTATAAPDGDIWRLHGEKWFCSNAGADLALVLARPAGAPAGTRGLGLYAMPRVLPDGTRNSYVIRRLKDKLGTRSMATGEIDLAGAAALPVGAPGRGFALMAEMINLSRLYNSVGSVAIMARSFVEAHDWAHEREAFGRKLVGHPLVRDTLEQLAAETDGCQALVWDVIGRLDRLDGGLGTDGDRRLVRILTPLAKLYTAKRAVWAASEAIEVLGGNGYVEEFITPRLLRDGQVLPIWEGTTNIQTLDVFRALDKDDAADVLFPTLREALDAAPAEATAVAERLREHMDELESALAGLRGFEGDAWTVAGREWAFRLAPAVCAALLVAEAAVAAPEDRGSLARHADRLVAMHLEGWTATGLLEAAGRGRRLAGITP